MELASTPIIKKGRPRPKPKVEATRKELSGCPLACQDGEQQQERRDGSPEAEDEAVAKRSDQTGPTPRLQLGKAVVCWTSACGRVPGRC